MNRLSKTLITASVTIIITSIVLIYIYSNIISTSTILNYSGGNTIGPITQSRTYIQSFTAEEDNLCSVELLMATYARINDSNIVFQLNDNSGNIITSQNINASILADNSYYSISFSPISDSAGKQYSVMFYSDADDENALTAWASTSDLYSGGTLIIDDVDTGIDMAFGISYANYSTAGIFPIICAFLAILIIIIYNSLSIKETAKLTAKLIYWLIFSISISFLAADVYTIWAYQEGLSSSISVFSGVGFYRILILLMALLPFSAFIFFDLKKTTDFIFNRRWWIAFVVFLVLVSNKITLSNVSMYSEYIQPNMKTEYTEPLFGWKRAIRSDEWLVDLPRKASAEYVDYGAENDLVRGTYNTGLAASGLQISYSALSNPLNWGYYLFGTEYGNSFYWIALMILTFMSSFELCYIISNKSRLAALFGASAIGLSQYLLWWSIIQYYFIFAQIIVVCGYYFFNTQKKSNKISLALGVALAGAGFICALYPAFQVPIAYIIIALVAWVVIENISSIKKMGKEDWIIIVCAFVFMVSIVISYLIDNRFYIENVMNTVYPGQRRSSGGYALNKLLDYFQTLLFPIRDVGNNSEAGIMFNLFPVPLIVSLYSLIQQIVMKIRNKSSKIDVLNITLLAVFVLFMTYCTVGIPDWLAKITLLDYSIPERCVDWLGVVMIYMIVRNIGQTDSCHFKMPSVVALIVSFTTVLLGIYCSNKDYPGFMSMVYVGAISIISFGFCYSICCKTSENFRKAAVLSLTAVVAVSGMCVLPITKGLDALIEKPAAKIIRQISKEEPDVIWAAYCDLTASNYIIANGGKCITSTNYIPNMELWSSLDEYGQYADIYNRYAHIVLTFTTDETSFSLLSADTFSISLNYDDINKCGIDYMFSCVPLSSMSSKVFFDKTYQEDGVYIYKVEYNDV